MSGTGSQQNAEIPVKFALIKAVKNHDESEVKKLIAARVDVNEADYQGKTALLYAVQNNVDIEIIKALVDSGEATKTVNATDRYNRNSLFYAITKSKDTAAYLFEKTDYFNNSNVSSILSFFLESLCTKRHDSHPTIDDVVPLLESKGLKPEILARSIVNILLCKIPLLLTSVIDNHRPNSDHPMFHLHEKRKYLLCALKEACECKFIESYPKKESIKEVLKMIGGDRNRGISDTLNSLKEHDPNPNFADSEGNTAFHYAACLPWMNVPTETIKEICQELKSFGVPWNKKNLQDQTPLLICLSGSMEHLKDDDKLTATKRLVEVCLFLVTRGSSLKETTQDRESVFHLVIKLFQQGFEIPEQTIRQGVIDEMMKLLDCFTPRRVNKTVVRQRNDDLNSPLHLWASLALTKPDYTSSVTQKHTFEQLLKVIFDHLLNCGALKNDRNRNEETPLHLCNTWGAVKLLINNGAKTSDEDSSKRPPLLAAASRKTFLRNPPYFFPDFYLDVKEVSKSDDPKKAKDFFTAAADKDLDPWKVDKFDKSVLGFLIEYRTYVLSKALVEVACKLEENSQDTSERILVSLLNAICKDESLYTHWKVELVKTVLSCAKENNIDVVKEPFDFCCKTMTSQLAAMEENQQLHFNDEPFIHCSIAQVLRSHGAELSGESYETIKAKCKEIDQILKNIPVQELVPWTSISKKHQKVLHKVARRQEFKEISRIICCQASAGSFGTNLLVGINKSNSKEVAIKRIEETQCTQDLKNLYGQLDCEQVIRYFLHLKEVGHVYIVFELMEGNLYAYLNDDAFKLDKSTSLCGDIVKGLKYLHKKEIRHFHDHLKPTSIFYKTDPKLCLKITDFDHSQPADGTSNIYVWSSPEVLKKLENHSEFSDMFSCGLLLHYILSKGKHPFSPAGSTGTSDIVSKTELNIKDNNSKVEDSLSPEGTHLVKNMLGDKEHRKSAAEALDHPFFWSKKKKLDLLVAVGNQPEFECPRAKRTLPLTAVETELEARFGIIVKYVEWNNKGNKHMSDIYKEMGKKRKYDTRSVVELVRLIRNAYAHVSESTRPEPIRKQLLEDFVFLEYFPNLVMEVYKTVTTHGWDQTREEIKYALKK